VPLRTIRGSDTNTAAAEIPIDRIEAELVAHAKWETTGMAHMLELLGEFDR
jgi:hypothetical protein